MVKKMVGNLKLAEILKSVTSLNVIPEAKMLKISKQDELKIKIK